MPYESPSPISPMAAEAFDLETGNGAEVAGRESGGSVILSIMATNRVKGQTLYTSFHKSRSKMEHDIFVHIVGESTSVPVIALPCPRIAPALASAPVRVTAKT